MENLVRIWPRLKDNRINACLAANHPGRKYRRIVSFFFQI